MSPLDEVEQFIGQFVAYPSPAAATAHVLWIAHAHLIDCFDNSPRLAFLSPEPGSGKSRALEVTEPLVPRPVVTVNSTPSYVFRKISDVAGLPTLLFDEVDAVFGARPSDSSEDLRGLLNSGYRRGATAGRAVVRGKEVMTEELPSFCAVAMAGLNQLPDTIMTRSIVIRMQRRRPSEIVLPYRRRVYQPEAERLNAALRNWAVTAVTEVTDSWPVLPKGIEDRDADVWEPLISVADAAGGSWPSRARDAAVYLVNEAKSKPATLGIRLLTDIQTAMGTDTRITTHELVDRLCEMETAPWASIKGERIDSRFLARNLSKYGIDTNNTFKLNGIAVKGYTRQHFNEAWERYVPAPSTEVGNFGNSSNQTLEIVA
ncbi:MAG: hypothetical protein JWN80_1391 [Microbacteriaceae bacterium]|nr:hypothetical protein [Microbacteriaceae bacterium]